MHTTSKLQNLSKYIKFKFLQIKYLSASHQEKKWIHIFVMTFSNLRVPSKRVAIVSRNVFWGARSPFRAGIGAGRNLDLYLTSPMKKKRFFYGNIFEKYSGQEN